MIEEQIGRGGMGAVYIATDLKFGSRAAIKERTYENAELASAFEREARLLNSLHHPILPHVSDYFREEGKHFLVMEYIEGEDLSSILARDGAFPVDEVFGWTLELLDGLDYLHSQDPPVIHRDIKPNNLKRTSRGNVVLLDFGLAKESAGNTLAARSVFGYSRRYSPLEQIEGTGTDARSDIFSLGSTVFHLLSGEPPIDVLGRASAIVAGNPDPLPLLSTINPQVPEPIAAVIGSALALDPEKRFESAKAMATALQYAAGTRSGTEANTADESGGVHQLSALPAALAPIQANIQNPGRSTANLGAPSVSDAAPAPRERVRVRLLQPFWQRPAVWSAAVLGCILLFSYAIYRIGLSGETTPAAGEQLAPAPATAQQSANIPDQSIPGDPEQSSEAIAEPESAPVKNETTADPGKRPPKPGRIEVAKERLAEPDVPKPQQKAPTKRTRPRMVQPTFEGQPAVSDIESIFTGLPPGGRRGAVKPRRELTSWEQDELRRQRMQNIRDARRWPPPF